MSGIPPNWLGSIIQTQGAQQRSAADKAKERASQAERAGEGSFADSLQDVIEATDRDSQVYADAEGQGHQGRPSDGEEAENAAPPRDEETPLTGGLDVEA